MLEEEYSGIPTTESFLNAMHRVASNDEFCDNNFDFDASFIAFISELLHLGENIQIISGVHRVRASHWSKIKKLYLASWLMNTSPFELLDSAFMWLRSNVKSKWISRISVKENWALIHIFTEYCSVFYLLVFNIRPWTCSGESKRCKKICEF